LYLREICGIIEARGERQKPKTLSPLPSDFLTSDEVNTMQINRYKRWRSRQKLLVALGLVFIAGISFAGALLWQPTQLRLVPGMALPALAPVREEVTPPLVGAPPQAEVLTPPAPVEFTPGQFALSWQVAPSEPVDVAYFDDAIFFGDSLSTGFVTHRLFRNAAVVAAIGASPAVALEEPLIPTTYGMATMLEAAQEKGPRGKVYIMLGSQALELSTEEFVEGYRQFIAAVREQYPGATIYIMSMPPVAAHVGDFHPGVSRERVIELNSYIAELARVSDLPFLNVFDALAGPDGYLPAHGASDGLHLSAEYHFVLLDFLKAHTLEGAAAG